MSKSREFRQALKDHLVAEVADLSADDVIILRNKSLTEELELVTAQATNGIAVTIGAGRGRNNDRESPSLSMVASYDVTLWVTPIYWNGEFPEIDLFEPMMIACHGRKVAIANEHFCQYEMKVEDFEDQPDPEYLAMKFTVSRLLQF